MANDPLAINIPGPATPIADLATGYPARSWWYVLQRLVARTGGATGLSTGDAAGDALFSLMDDDETGPLALARVGGVEVALAMTDTFDAPHYLPVPALLMGDAPEPASFPIKALLMSDAPDLVDARSILLTSLALQD